jgi:hypothetical protein
LTRTTTNYGKYGCKKHEFNIESNQKLQIRQNYRLKKIIKFSCHNNVSSHVQAIVNLGNLPPLLWNFKWKTLFPIIQKFPKITAKKYYIREGRFGEL